MQGLERNAENSEWIRTAKVVFLVLLGISLMPTLVYLESRLELALTVQKLRNKILTQAAKVKCLAEKLLQRKAKQVAHQSHRKKNNDTDQKMTFDKKCLPDPVRPLSGYKRRYTHCHENVSMQPSIESKFVAVGFDVSGKNCSVLKSSVHSQITPMVMKPSVAQLPAVCYQRKMTRPRSYERFKLATFGLIFIVNYPGGAMAAREISLKWDFYYSRFAHHEVGEGSCFNGRPAVKNYTEFPTFEGNSVLPFCLEPSVDIPCYCATAFDGSPRCSLQVDAQSNPNEGRWLCVIATISCHSIGRCVNGGGDSGQKSENSASGAAQQESQGSVSVTPATQSHGSSAPGGSGYDAGSGGDEPEDGRPKKVERSHYLDGTGAVKKKSGRKAQEAEESSSSDQSRPYFQPARPVETLCPLRSFHRHSQTLANPHSFETSSVVPQGCHLQKGMSQGEEKYQLDARKVEQKTARPNLLSNSGITGTSILGAGKRSMQPIPNTSVQSWQQSKSQEQFEAGDANFEVREDWDWDPGIRSIGKGSLPSEEHRNYDGAGSNEALSRGQDEDESTNSSSLSTASDEEVHGIINRETDHPASNLQDDLNLDVIFEDFPSEIHGDSSNQAVGGEWASIQNESENGELQEPLLSSPTGNLTEDDSVDELSVSMASMTSLAEDGALDDDVDNSNNLQGNICQERYEGPLDPRSSRAFEGSGQNLIIQPDDHCSASLNASSRGNRIFCDPSRSSGADGSVQERSIRPTLPPDLCRAFQESQSSPLLVRNGAERGNQAFVGHPDLLRIDRVFNHTPGLYTARDDAARAGRVFLHPPGDYGILICLQGNVCPERLIRPLDPRSSRAFEGSGQNLIIQPDDHHRASLNASSHGNRIFCDPSRSSGVDGSVRERSIRPTLPPDLHRAFQESQSSPLLVRNGAERGNQAFVGHPDMFRTNRVFNHTPGLYTARDDAARAGRVFSHPPGDYGDSIWSLYIGLPHWS